MRYERPTTLQAASQLLAKEKGSAYVLAGGTDLLVRLRTGFIEPDLIVDIKRIAATRDGGRTWGTQYVENVSGERRIGAIAAASASDVWAVSTGEILRLFDATGSLRVHLPVVGNP